MTSPAEDPGLAALARRDPLAAHSIRYGFGFEPLEQFLVETERGRLQVLPWAWDARPAAAGGQRWFTPDPSAADEWRGPTYNWNHACAECHSTGLHKAYDAEHDAFATRFAELDVSCEACHGPASEHVRWAAAGRSIATPKRGFEFELRGADLGAWRARPNHSTAERIASVPLPNEIDVCARCHSRRTQIHEDHPRGASLLDTHVPALIEPPLYFEDGQIRAEVYEYGSFLQSKMHGAHVTCTDCHDPHGLQLRAPGNALCGRCHAPDTFDVPAHHHHDPERAGAACVACHMPARTYMQVDPRRDHSLRIPRPDLSVSLGVPNPCAACHAQVGAEVLARQVASWGRPLPRPRHFGEVLARARAGDSSVADALVELLLAPDTALMVRASAAALLGSVELSGGPAQAFALVEAALAHEQPLVRLAALRALEGASADVRRRAAAARLSDPVRAVRFAALRLLADLELEGGERAALERALAESLAALDRDADRAEAQVERGNLLADRGRPEPASLAYARALQLDPGFAPGYVNWCDLLRRRGDEAGCAAKLAEGLARAPDSAELHYARALSRIRSGQHADAIEDLTAALRLAPEIPDYAYALVLALRERGEARASQAVLSAARDRHPHDQALRSLDAGQD